MKTNLREQDFMDSAWKMAQSDYVKSFRENCPADKEILEVDEYIDCMITTEKQMRLTYEIPGSQEILQNYHTPLVEMVMHLQENDRDKSRQELSRIFRVQEETVFLQSDNSISSSFLYPGMPPHWHENAYFDVIYVYEGKCQCHFRSETVVMKKGDVLIVPPHVEHGEGVRDLQGKTLTSGIRTDTFRETFFRVFSGNHLLYSFFMRILSGEKELRYLWFPAPEDGEDDIGLSMLFNQLYREEEEKENYHNEMCNTLMNAIFVILLRNREQSMILPPEFSIRWKGEYAEIFQYIGENFRTVTLEDLEKAFHYSKRQLIRIIQNTTGRNFTEVIRDMRMERACLLLRETSLSVERISEECGYENVSGFSRIFRQTKGISPGKYRKNSRQTVEVDA